MPNYAQHVSTKVTPQSQLIPGKTQVKNSAGGFVYQLDCWKRLERFLILGNEGGTYYASEKKLTVENAKCIQECASRNIDLTIDTIVTISETGRAPKNGPTVFALALLACDSNPIIRSKALTVLPHVCRIGTHLFQFVDMVKEFRGWGRGLRNAIANWYTSKDANKLAYQVTKYQQRGGWSHRDLLRLSHPKTADPLLSNVIKYAAKKYEETDRLPELIEGVEAIKRTDNVKTAIYLIEKYNLVREHIPTEFFKYPEIWEAMLPHMPIIALIRNLGKISNVGLLKPLSNSISQVVSKINNPEVIQRSKIHPFQILLALNTYRQGHGDKGKLTWTVVPQILDALDSAFYLAFKNVEPTNKRIFIGLDVSGSMGGSYIAGSTITAREASAAMCLVTMKTEPNYFVAGFTSGRRHSGFGYNAAITPLDFSKLSRLIDVVRYVQGLPFGGTDCALPMIYALENKIPVDTFIIYTDNETWAGNIHPSQALMKYRSQMGISAKLIVVGMTATDFTIADPNDGGMMDVVGFDAAAPSVMSDFMRD